MPTREKVELFVGPRNGRASRDVVARYGEREFRDVFDPFRASARDKFVKNIFAEFKIGDADDTVLRSELVKKAEEADTLVAEAAKEAAAQTQADGSKDQSARALANTPRDILAAAESFLDNSDLMGELASDFATLGIAGETSLATTVYLIGISRLLSKPLGGTVKASSSSGKSHVTETVILMMPEEEILVATDITQNALYYMPPGVLQHKLVCVGERKHMSSRDDADAANATLALREMMSRGRLDKFVPQKTENGMMTQHIIQEGPISYLETTTQQEIFEEDATRMLSLCTDESWEQTAAIMAVQAQQATWRNATDEEKDFIIEKHRTAQRLLRPLKVCIPFARALVLPNNNLIARRAYPQLLAVVEVVAVLRQRQKQIRGDGHINASLVDYEIAHSLMLPILQRTFAPLSARAISLFAALRERVSLQTEFCRADCVTWAGVGPTEVRNRLNLLVDAGMVEQVTGGRGVRYKYKILPTTSAASPALCGLVTPAELRERLDRARAARTSQAIS